MLVRILIRLLLGKRRKSRPKQREPFVVITNPIPPPPVSTLAPTVLRGQCWVVDGDTIVIDKTHIRGSVGISAIIPAKGKQSCLD